MSEAIDKAVAAIIDELPAGAVGYRLFGRHSESVQEGPQETRTLTDEGVVHCVLVEPFYKQLINSLEDFLRGGTYFSCSPLPRSLLSVFLATGAKQIIQDKRLALLASLKKVRDGAWLLKLKGEGKTMPEILTAFMEDKSLWEGQPFEENIQQYSEWATERPYNRLGVTFAHEPIISLTMSSLELPDKPEPGLKECESFLFCLDGEGTVIKVIKVVPPVAN